ncbi:MAG: CPBP family intramembrane metalloprotease [Pirellulales bacterium]|nr:CPBP family intramembrane metalloprotease [Pirellulales bacterium]
MNEIALPQNAAWISALVLAGIVACVAAWVRVALLLVRGEAPFPYEPRRPVPWRFGDVAAILLVYLIPPLAGLALGLAGLEPGRTAPDVKARPEELGVSHPVLDLLASGPGTATLLFCVFVVVVVAPVVEEFLFRLVLQGWLERIERHGLRHRGLRRKIYGAMPILVTAVLFASLHFRTVQPKLDPARVIDMLSQVAVWNLVVLGLGVALLRLRSGATLADLGLQPQRILPDIGLGLTTFFAIAPPIYFLQAVLHYFLSDFFAPDPITLVFFAVALGLLYFRTHRITAPVALHVALNGTSLLIAWLAGG